MAHFWYGCLALLIRLSLQAFNITSLLSIPCDKTSVTGSSAVNTGFTGRYQSESATAETAVRAHQVPGQNLQCLAHRHSSSRVPCRPLPTRASHNWSHLFSTLLVFLWHRHCLLNPVPTHYLESNQRTDSSGEFCHRFQSTVVTPFYSGCVHDLHQHR